MGENMQYIYYGMGVVSILFTIITTHRHSEQQYKKTIVEFEKRMVRIETFVMMCCKKLDVPTHDINN